MTLVSCEDQQIDILNKMKFVVLALFVSMATAAVPRWQQAAQVAAKTVAAPAVLTAKAASVAASAVAGAASDVAAPILKFDSEVAADGFNYAYETGNGISASSSGSLKTVDNIDTLVVQGAYHYVAPDGTPVNFEYVADENGYQPRSDLLPVGPAIPDYIVRSLDYIASHPPKEEPKYRN